MTAFAITDIPPSYHHHRHEQHEPSVPPKRGLPDKVLIGYATSCDEKVTQAVRNGVNVVIWSFIEIHSTTSSNLHDGDDVGDSGEEDKEEDTVILKWNSLDATRIRRHIHDLDEEGYSDTIHLVSFGGWNGPHLDTRISCERWFKTWRGMADDIGFHGIDWDLEGHDDIHSPTNHFSVDCLNRMGCISRMAKEEGYIIGIAPPQSYLDTKNTKFSRSVTLMDKDRTWHDDFHYFGSNVYAYLLAKYGEYIDLISIQFYESYSRAAMTIYGPQKMNAASYFEMYVHDLASKNFSTFIEFENDPTIGLYNQWVSIPSSKLVFGFANGWALDTDDKALFVSSKDIEIAYQNLKQHGLDPRGFMFWVIGEEGKNGVQYAPSLGRILNTPPEKTSTTTASEL